TRCTCEDRSRTRSWACGVRLYHAEFRPSGRLSAQTTTKSRRHEEENMLVFFVPSRLRGGFMPRQISEVPPAVHSAAPAEMSRGRSRTRPFSVDTVSQRAHSASLQPRDRRGGPAPGREWRSL